MQISREGVTRPPLYFVVWDTGYQFLLRGAVAWSVHLENVSQMVSRIFTPVDAFIIYTFLLLYVHFSFDATFIELQFLD